MLSSDSLLMLSRLVFGKSTVIIACFMACIRFCVASFHRKRSGVFASTPAAMGSGTLLSGGETSLHAFIFGSKRSHALTLCGPERRSPAPMPGASSTCEGDSRSDPSPAQVPQAPSQADGQAVPAATRVSSALCRSPSLSIVLLSKPKILWTLLRVRAKSDTVVSIEAKGKRPHGQGNLSP